MRIRLPEFMRIARVPEGTIVPKTGKWARFGRIFDYGYGALVVIVAFLAGLAPGLWTAFTWAIFVGWFWYIAALHRGASRTWQDTYNRTARERDFYRDSAEFWQQQWERQNNEVKS